MVPPEVTLRLAALFHDLGKPATFSMGEDGQGHFYGHPKVSAALAEQILLRLRAPKRLREEVSAWSRSTTGPSPQSRA